MPDLPNPKYGPDGRPLKKSFFSNEKKEYENNDNYIPETKSYSNTSSKKKIFESGSIYEDPEIKKYLEDDISDIENNPEKQEIIDINEKINSRANTTLIIMIIFILVFSLLGLGVIP